MLKLNFDSEVRSAADKLPRVGSVRHRRRRSHKLLAAGITLLIVAGIGGASAFGFASLKARAEQLQAGLTADLQVGQQQLELGKASLSLANKQHDENWRSWRLINLQRRRNNFLRRASSRITVDFLMILRTHQGWPILRTPATSRSTESPEWA
jgi:hypothetical protein